MKKKFLIGGMLLLVVVLSISLFLIFDKDEEEKVELKDYSYVNVESLKTSDINTLRLENFTVRDVRIKNGYLEGSFLTNSEDSYDNLNIIVNIYDEDGNKLEEIDFEFNNVLPNEERDLFYPIQSDLSNAYYVSVEER